MGLQETMKALADPTRREILKLLRNQSRSAGDISAQFDMTAATVSHHLSVLKEAKLILQEKKGKYIYYEINTTILEDIFSFIQELKGDNHASED